jgi:hypothetical protein
MVESILRELMCQGDLQSVAMFACVLSSAEEDVRAERGGSGGSGATTTSQPQAAAAAAPPFAILAPSQQRRCNRFIGTYAWVLQCRGLVLEATAVRSRRWPSGGGGGGGSWSPDRQLPVEEEPREAAPEPAAAGGGGGEGVLGTPAPVPAPPLSPTAAAGGGGGGSAGADAAELYRCSVCRLPVRGLGNVCALCGHVGHVACLRSWFVGASKSSCAAGCGCQCIRHLLR